MSQKKACLLIIPFPQPITPNRPVTVPRCAKDDSVHYEDVSTKGHPQQPPPAVPAKEVDRCDLWTPLAQFNLIVTIWTAL